MPGRSSAVAPGPRMSIPTKQPSKRQMPPVAIKGIEIIRCFLVVVDRSSLFTISTSGTVDSSLWPVDLVDYLSRNFFGKSSDLFIFMIESVRLMPLGQAATQLNCVWQ